MQMYQPLSLSSPSHEGTQEESCHQIYCILVSGLTPSYKKLLSNKKTYMKSSYELKNKLLNLDQLPGSSTLFTSNAILCTPIYVPMLLFNKSADTSVTTKMSLLRFLIKPL